MRAARARGLVLARGFRVGDVRQVPDLAEVEPVHEEISERASAEQGAAVHATVKPGNRLGAGVARVGVPVRAPIERG